MVLDSVGIGEMPDAAQYGDAGSNTLAAASKSPYFSMPHMQELGLFNIDGVTCRPAVEHPSAAFARMTELSKGKDTTIGHWEIAGIASPKPLPTYPNGFPQDLLAEFSRRVGAKGVVQPAVFGDGSNQRLWERACGNRRLLIVYTSADSVFQIAAHEAVVPVEELYRDCRDCTGAVDRGTQRWAGDCTAVYRRISELCPHEEPP